MPKKEKKEVVETKATKNEKKENKVKSVKKDKKEKNNSIKSIRAELKKVTWPTPKQLVNKTIAVIAIVLIVSIIVFLFARKFSNTYLENETKIEHINDIFDALGLGIFAVMGTKAAFVQGYENYALISITCGVLTCICGGMLRDVLTNSTPFVLVKRIYAIAAIAGAATYYLLYIYGRHYGIEDSLAMVVGVAVTFVLRILAMTFKWNMPKAIK